MERTKASCDVRAKVQKDRTEWRIPQLAGGVGS